MLESSRLLFESEHEIHLDRLLLEIPGPGMSRLWGGDEEGDMYTLGVNIPGLCCVAAILSVSLTLGVTTSVSVNVSVSVT